MITRKHRPLINAPIVFFGAHFYDLLTLTAVFSIVLLGLGLVNTFLRIPIAPVIPFLLVLYVIGYIVLRQALKRGEQGFVSSFISFHFFQPKHIRFYDRRSKKG